MLFLFMYGRAQVCTVWVRGLFGEYTLKALSGFYMRVWVICDGL